MDTTIASILNDSATLKASLATNSAFISTVGAAAKRLGLGYHQLRNLLRKHGLMPGRDKE